MIDLSQLSQEQLEGLAYATQTANEPIKAENEQITQSNASLPEGEEPKPLKDLWTSQTYIENTIRMACDSYYRQAYDEKWRLARLQIESLPKDQQQQIADSLNVQNVINS